MFASYTVVQASDGEDKLPQDKMDRPIPSQINTVSKHSSSHDMASTYISRRSTIFASQ